MKALFNIQKLKLFLNDKLKFLPVKWKLSFTKKKNFNTDL